MDKLRAMETFVRIVDRGSLTAAAETLSTSLPSVVRTLAALEAELGVRLLNRTTRRLSPTDEGREYFERSKRVLAEVDEAEAALSARRVAPKGRLRITAPVMFGRLRVAPLVTEFVLRHPALQIELTLLDRIVDLVEEGIDAGVRIARLPDSTLVAVPVGQTRRVVCASPAYLKRAGTPKTPQDLMHHRCISFSGLARGQRMESRRRQRSRADRGPLRARHQPGRRCYRRLPARSRSGPVSLLPGAGAARRRQAQARAAELRARARADPARLPASTAVVDQCPRVRGLGGAAAAGALRRQAEPKRMDARLSVAPRRRASMTRPTRCRRSPSSQVTTPDATAAIPIGR